MKPSSVRPWVVEIQLAGSNEWLAMGAFMDQDEAVTKAASVAYITPGAVTRVVPWQQRPPLRKVL